MRYRIKLMGYFSYKNSLIIALGILLFPVNAKAYAVDRAFIISDTKIIASLTESKQGQVNLDNRFDHEKK